MLFQEPISKADLTTLSKYQDKDQKLYDFFRTKLQKQALEMGFDSDKLSLYTRQLSNLNEYVGIKCGITSTLKSEQKAWKTQASFDFGVPTSRLVLDAVLRFNV